MAIEDIVLARIAILEKYLKILKKIRKKELDVFLADDILIGSAERYLQISIECITDIGNHIVSAETLGKASSYAEIFRILQANEIISKQLMEKMIIITRFRNRLVYAYMSIDPKVIYSIINDDLDDVLLFKKEILDFLKRRKPNK